MSHPTLFTAVYGPVRSWRFGQSLGIDPIGSVSTCSFDCVYCQLGKIEQSSCNRQLFVPTQQIAQELRRVDFREIDVVTLSGSGEPTLALNLGEILATVKGITSKPVVVLTNGSLLSHAAVRRELAIADCVAIKLDAMNADQFSRVNRPISGMELSILLANLFTFRQDYSGRLAIQTMLLTDWSDEQQESYIALIRALCPDEIQLNTPTRPKPTVRHLEARANNTSDFYPDMTRSLKPVSPDALQRFAERIQSTIAIPVRYPQISSSAELNMILPIVPAGVDHG